jgi:hypothetical protein
MSSIGCVPRQVHPALVTEHQGTGVQGLRPAARHQRAAGSCRERCTRRSLRNKHRTLEILLFFSDGASADETTTVSGVTAYGQAW